MSNRFDVVISGASYSGLALASALAQFSMGGLRIALVEREPWPGQLDVDTIAGDSPRAFALSAASKRMLDVLGAWSLIEPIAQPVSDIDITDSRLNDGVRPVVLSYANLLSGGEPASFIVPDSEVKTALRGVLEQYRSRSVTIIGSVEVVGSVADENGVTLSLSDGSEIMGALVVAAEGRRSRLRSQAGIKLLSWDYEQTGIVTRVRHERPHDGRAVQHFLPSGPFAILPLTGDRSCITWTEAREVAERILALDDDGFLSEVDKRFGGRRGKLELDGARQSWPLSMHLARSFVAPRLALIGDTAHGVHPLAGQGLNLGFRDVAALTEVLIENARLGIDVGDFEALQRYERWRRFDSTLSSAVFDGLNRLFSNDNPVLRAVRDAGLAIVDRMPGVKDVLVAEAGGVSGELPRMLRGEAV